MIRHAALPRLLALATVPLALTLALGAASPAHARDMLGIFGDWAAFRDPAVPRCYAIAQPAHVSNGPRTFAPYADVGNWPRRQVHGAFHLRLPRRTAPGTPVTLNLGGRHFVLVGGGGDAWAADARMDAAITAAMRSAEGMSVSAHDTSGHSFGASWHLAGAATAMDSALVGCASLK